MPYNRNKDLPRVIAVWPSELGDDLISRTKLVAKLESACRAERQRGLENHFTYSLPRHAALNAFLEFERKALTDMWAREHAL